MRLTSYLVGGERHKRCCGGGGVHLGCGGLIISEGLSGNVQSWKKR